MNRLIAKTGAAIVTAAVCIFAVCMLIPFAFGSYFVCMLLAIGYIMLAAGFCQESDGAHKTAAYTGMALAVVYAVLVLLVYFAQTTAVRQDRLPQQAMQILDYTRGGLFFSYDLLGYGMLALSTFFLGLTVRVQTQTDKWLKRLMILHGLFFPPCFLLPMTGAFASMADGKTSTAGVAALEFWCAYFFVVGVLAYRHFRPGAAGDVSGPEHADRADGNLHQKS